jgi:hypothetical protein
LINRYAKKIPPKCAKCATLSAGLFIKPACNSYMPYSIRKYFALIGIGSRKRYNLVCGYSMAKAVNTPNIAPEAPTIGMPVLR